MSCDTVGGARARWSLRCRRRAPMHCRFGQYFSQIRYHTGSGPTFGPTPRRAALWFAPLAPRRSRRCSCPAGARARSSGRPLLLAPTFAAPGLFVWPAGSALRGDNHRARVGTAMLAPSVARLIRPTCPLVARRGSQACKRFVRGYLSRMAARDYGPAWNSLQSGELARS
jgi:hypothetical protein